MPHADAKQRQVLLHLRYHLGRRLHFFWVSRAVAQQNTVRLKVEDFFGRRGIWQDNHVAFPLCQFPEDTVLDPEVDDDDVALRSRVRVRRLGRNLADHVSRWRRCLEFFNDVFHIGQTINNGTAQGPVMAELPHQFPGVNPLDPRNAAVAEEVR